MNDIEPYPALPKWEHCVSCGQPVRHEYTRWCFEHDPNRLKPTPWYMHIALLPVYLGAAFLLLCLLAFVFHGYGEL